MKKFEVKIEGTTPYLMNRFHEPDIDRKTKKRSAGLKEPDIEDKIYRLPDETIYVPATQIRGCLVNAGKQMRIPGKGKATFSKVFGFALQIEPEAPPMINQKFEIYRIAGVNPSTRGKMMISRPRFEKWSLEFEIISDEDTLDIEIVEEALNIGGKYVGIGDWRPDKKGRFGKFIVTSIKEAN